MTKRKKSLVGYTKKNWKLRWSNNFWRTKDDTPKKRFGSMTLLSNEKDKDYTKKVRITVEELKETK